ncbi:MAG TPA: RHS repeat-associated core domain-containing protein [Thermoanaerobaculia bacterium]|jgi:RHS repeat-associated protein|nr:RHS repeat-associated core domain-containing protein [Thermoanaerobaculia bacterium]
MRRSSVLVALFLSLAVSAAIAQDVQLQANAESSVGPDGDLRYSLSLLAPPGIGSASPDLSLVYGSRQPDGRLGVGWTLQGSSSIGRCAAIPAVDGFRGTIEYNAEDRYCLDGQRLINVAGTYGAAGSVYRTELETWRWVKASADLCGSGPCSFTVYNRAGGTSSYGTTAGSRILATGKPDVRVWALAAVSDLNGNTVSFSYTQSPISGVSAADGEYYLSRIDYTANAAAGFAATRSVRFVYGPRQQILAAWYGGSKVYTRAVLTGIRTFVGETLVRDYRLTYTQGPATGRPLLTQMQDCAGSDASAPCLPLADVLWQGEPKVTFKAGGLGPKLSPFSEVLPMDVNGDGRGDLAWVTSSPSTLQVQPLISQGKTLSPCATVLTLPNVPQARLLPAQVDRTSRAGLVLAYGDRGILHFAAFPSDPATCGFKSGPDQSSGFPAPADELWPMDANGDGLTDLVAAWLDGGFYTTVTFLGAETGFQKAGESRFQALPNQRFWPAEVNGDGMLDLIQAWYPDGGALHFTTYLSNGRSFDAGLDSQVASGSVDLAGLWPMDVNGDGKTDLVQGWSSNGALQLSTYLADGAGKFTQPTTTATGKGLTNVRAFWPMEADGDGRVDLVQAWQDGQQLRLIVYRNIDTGLDKGIAADAALAVPDVNAVWPTDIDGDGKTDLVQADTVSPSPVTLAGYFSQGPIPDLIATLTDGAGGQIAATYLPLSDPAVYEARDGAPPAESTDALGYAYRQSPAQAPFQRVGGSSMQVVRRLERRNDPSRNASTYHYADTYTYAEGLVDVVSGRGWLGFRHVTELDEQTGRRSITRRNQAFPLTGTVAEIEYQCDGAVSPDPLCPEGSSDTKLSDSETTYTTTVTATGATSPFPKVLEVLKQRVQLNTYSYGTYDFSRAKEYAYDAWGNMTLIADLGYVSADGQRRTEDDDVFTCAQYENVDRTSSGQGWELGYIVDRKVSKSRDCTDYSHFQDGIDFELEHFAYTRQRNLARHAVYDDVNRSDLATSFTYDGFGNQLTETLPGSRTTTYTYESQYHTYPATRTTPPDEAGRRLVRTFGYDPRFGIRVAETTPNGRVRIQCLDDHGRIARVQGPLPDKPAGVVADPNCVSPWVTGDATAFKSANVVTLQILERKSDADHRRYREVLSLQKWPLVGESPVFRWSRDYYDGLGRRYLETAQEDPAVGQLGACTNFDDSGDTVRASVPQYFTGAIDCTSSSGSGMLWSTLTYDVYGRQTRQVDPAGPDGRQTSVTTMVYDQDLRVTVTKAADDSYRFRKILDYDYYDSERKLRRMILPDDGNATSTFDYDRIGRLTKVTDPATADNPNGVANVITYDSVGRRTSIDNPDQNTTAAGSGRKALSLKYDATTGLLAQSTDAKSQTTTFAYDALGRITVKSLPGNGGTVRNVYDDPAANGLGELTSERGLAADGSALYAYSYAYDPYQNLVDTGLSLGGATYSSSWVLDPQARRIEETYPDGAAIQRSYAFGNLAEIRDGTRLYARFEEYTALGGPRRVSYGNGTSEALRYAPTGELIEQTVRDAAGSEILHETLSWNHLLELAKIDDLLKPGGVDFTQAFGHTQTRLTSAEASGLYGQRSFGYDKEGNLVANDGYAYRYQAHRIRSGTAPDRPPFGADYDDNGNLVRRTLGATSWGYGYDVRNRLTLASRDGVSLLSVPLYDDSGRRLRKLAPDGVETLYVSSDYEVTLFPGGNRETTRYVLGAAGVVATVTSGGAGRTAPGVPVPGTLYFHRNHLGSTVLTTDGAGRLSSRLAYLPYGSVYGPGTSGPDDFRRKFQGKELDEDAALYYFDARYYDPVLGRFLSADTELASDMTEVDAFNRFAFALNDPVTNVDPTGHAVWESILGVTIGVVEITLGVAVDVLSDGALEPVGGALIGAGLNGIQYSATHSGSFSWQQYGIQQGEGAAFGLLTGGFGGEAEAGVEVAATEATESVAARSAAEETGELAAENEGRSLTSAADEGMAEDAVEDSAGREDFNLEEESCEASFPAGTPVWTENGRTAIEALVPGAVLVSRNSIDFANGFHEVTGASSRPVRNLVRLTLRGDDGQSDELAATPNHPLWVEKRGWIAAREVAAGDRVGTLSGGWAAVERAEAFQSEEPQPVHSLEVAGFRSYFVGALGVWVHNPCVAIDRTGQGKLSSQGHAYDVELQVPRGEYPRSAAHIEAAQADGYSDVLTIERAGATANRRLSLRGIKTVKGWDRDEYPPAMFQEGGAGADVKLIDPSDNRASGSSFGGQLRPYGDYTRVWFHVVP